MTDYKPPCEDKAVSTDRVDISLLACDLQENKSSSVSKKKVKPSKAKHRHISTQTAMDDHICFQPMTGVSLKPYLQLRSSPSLSPESESEDEMVNEEKMEWMFHNSNTCARCHIIRPQVRLLRALKNNLGKYKPSQYDLKQYKDVMPDEVGWASLGSLLQNALVTIFKLNLVLGMLPLDPALKETSKTVTECLDHLLSHIPFPNSLTQTMNVQQFNQPRTRAMAAYLFGWKLKQVINLLRTVYRSSSATILPHYFKAELVQADRIAFKSLTFAVQGMRNTSMSHSCMNSDEEFVASSSEINTLSSTPSVDWYGVADMSSCSSSSDSDSDEAPILPKRKQVNNSAASCVLAESASQQNDISSRDPLVPNPHSVQNSTAVSILKGLSMPELLNMSRVVNAQISAIKAGQIQGDLLPKTTVSSASVSVSSVSVSSASTLPTMRTTSGSIHTITQPISSSFCISTSSAGTVHGRVVCNPITPGKFTDITKVVYSNPSTSKPLCTQTTSTIPMQATRLPGLTLSTKINRQSSLVPIRPNRTVSKVINSSQRSLLASKLSSVLACSYQQKGTPKTMPNLVTLITKQQGLRMSTNSNGNSVTGTIQRNLPTSVNGTPELPRQPNLSSCNVGYNPNVVHSNNSSNNNNALELPFQGSSSSIGNTSLLSTDPRATQVMIHPTSHMVQHDVIANENPQIGEIEQVCLNNCIIEYNTGNTMHANESIAVLNSKMPNKIKKKSSN